MYKLFVDKTELFECDIKLEGASLKNSQARLLIESPDLSLIFKGEIDSNGKCKIPIRKLKGILEENTQGNIKLEVIAEDTYFTPWESDFIIDISKKLTVEVKNNPTQNIISESKPKVTIGIIENTPDPILKENLVISKNKHIMNMLYLLIKENININTISSKQPQLNKIIGGYIVDNNLQTSKDKESIIEGLLYGLSKIK
jgi:hypothetical protein